MLILSLDFLNCALFGLEKSLDCQSSQPSLQDLPEFNGSIIYHTNSSLIFISTMYLKMWQSELTSVEKICGLEFCVVLGIVREGSRNTVGQNDFDRSLARLGEIETEI